MKKRYPEVITNDNYISELNLRWN